MATPDSITIANVTGCYTIHKTLSDDPEESMTLRGVPWAIRKAMKVAPALCLTITHHPTASPPSMTVLIPGLGPIKAHEETQRLDWEWNERSNPMMGTVRARARTVKVAEIEEKYLGEGWVGEEVLYTEEFNDKDGWEAKNVWGYQMVDGLRYYCRKTSIKDKKGATSDSRVVHEYKPIPV